ncbi:MAG TPA: hypothetical protein VKM00_01605, partial [Luteimonas sp.]|nr:hypothetical protein [Luteimonas sp.]
MGKLYTRFLPACWVLAVLLLAQNLFLWGGVAVTPQVGDRIMDQASLQSPVAWTYLVFGKLSVNPIGLSDSARNYAAGRFSAVYPDVALDEHTALDRLLAAQGALFRAAYWLGPIFLLLAIVLQLIKPKPIR